MKRGQTSKQRTLRLLDQIGPVGRFDEKHGQDNNWYCNSTILIVFLDKTPAPAPAAAARGLNGYSSFSPRVTGTTQVYIRKMEF